MGYQYPKIHFSGEDFFLTLAPVIGASGVILLAPLKILVVFTLLSKFGLVASAGDVELAAEAAWLLVMLGAVDGALAKGFVPPCAGAESSGVSCFLTPGRMSLFIMSV